MKSTQVKSHKRKGRVVKSHSRAVKGAMKNSGSGMSAEECKDKYDAMVAKYGENSPQAKKLAMKMEGMETVEKDARKIAAKKVSAFEKADYGRMMTMANSKDPKKRAAYKAEVLANRKKAGMDEGGYGKKVKKHSRGDYMRKNVEEDLLTKEARAKMRTAKNSAARGILAKGTQVSGFGIKDYRKALSDAPKKIGSATPKNKKVKLRGDMGKIGYKKGSITDKW